MWTISSPSVPLSKYSMATSLPISIFSASRNDASICCVDEPGVLSTDMRIFNGSACTEGDARTVTARAAAIPPTVFRIFFMLLLLFYATQHHAEQSIDSAALAAVSHN